MKLSSIGGISAIFNIIFGAFTVLNNQGDLFWQTVGMIALVVAGVIIGMSFMERFIHNTTR